MEIISLNLIFDLLAQYRYFFLFPITVIEGPIITIMAGYLSHTGFLNIYYAFAIVVSGDLIGDIMFYSIGRWGRMQLIEKWGHYIGLNLEKIIGLEKIFNQHRFKALFLGKFTFGIGGMIIIAAGAAHVPFGRFFAYSILGTIPKSLLLLIAGIYIGNTYSRINEYFDYTAIFSLSIAALIIFGYYIIERLSKKYIKNNSL